MKRIYLMLVALIAVSASAENAMWLRYPSISPDGKNVAFSYKGDIYTGMAGRSSLFRIFASS